MCRPALLAFMPTKQGGFHTIRRTGATARVIIDNSLLVVYNQTEF